MGVTELSVLCLILTVLLVWNEVRFHELKEDYEYFRKTSLEIMNVYYEDINYLKDVTKNTTLTVAEVIKEMRGESRE